MSKSSRISYLVPPTPNHCGHVVYSVSEGLAGSYQNTYVCTSTFSINPARLQHTHIPAITPPHATWASSDRPAFDSISWLDSIRPVLVFRSLCAIQPDRYSSALHFLLLQSSNLDSDFCFLILLLYYYTLLTDLPPPCLVDSLVYPPSFKSASLGSKVRSSTARPR
jgi:hypothetical protein